MRSEEDRSHDASVVAIVILVSLSISFHICSSYYFIPVMSAAQESYLSSNFIYL